MGGGGGEAGAASRSSFGNPDHGSTMQTSSHVRAKNIGKALLDNAPVIANFIAGLTTSSKVIYICIWCSMSIAVLAIVVDGIYCRHRWSAGLPAVWPKVVTLTFCVMNATILILMYMGIVSSGRVQKWSGVVTTSGLFFATCGSLFVGKPFAYAYAVEFLPIYRLRFFADNADAGAIFNTILRAVTKLWAATFFVLIGVNIGCAFMRSAGDATVSAIIGSGGSIAVVVVTARALQPKVIEIVVKRAKTRFDAEVSPMRGPLTPQ